MLKRSRCVLIFLQTITTTTKRKENVTPEKGKMASANKYILRVQVRATCGYSLWRARARLFGLTTSCDPRFGEITGLKREVGASVVENESLEV